MDFRVGFIRVRVGFIRVRVYFLDLGVSASPYTVRRWARRMRGCGKMRVACVEWVRVGNSMMPYRFGIGTSCECTIHGHALSMHEHACTSKHMPALHAWSVAGVWVGGWVLSGGVG